MSRSVFNFKYPVKGSFNLGEICPIGAPIEVVPGDEFKTDIALVIRMATPIAPLMDDLDAEITAHFVPLRLISNANYGDITNAGYIEANSFTNFEKIIANGVGSPNDWFRADNQMYSVPTATWNAAAAKTAGYTTIGEALGLGLGIGTTSVNKDVSAYPLYGYNLIYQERFRNQDVEQIKTSLALGSNLYGASGTPTATTGTDATYNHGLSVAYKHGDYFTNGKPSVVKGQAVPILGLTAPVGFMPTTTGTASAGSQAAITSGTNYTNGVFTQLKMNGNVTDISGKNVYADLSSATNTVNEFITAYNVQRLLFNDIKGTRYFDVVKNHYGVENEDIKLYIPQLLNIKRFAINISPVIQQSGSAAATSSTDQGNYLGTTGGYSLCCWHFHGQ